MQEGRKLLGPSVSRESREESSASTYYRDALEEKTRMGAKAAKLQLDWVTSIFFLLVFRVFFLLPPFSAPDHAAAVWAGASSHAAISLVSLSLFLSFSLMPSRSSVHY